MTSRRFTIIMAAWAVAIALALTGVGAVVGFFAGFGFAMYGGAAAVTLKPAAKLFGADLSFEGGLTIAAIALAALLAIGILVTLTRGSLMAQRGDYDRARQQWSYTAAWVGIPLVLWLSMRSLQRNWPM